VTAKESPPTHNHHWSLHIGGWKEKLNLVAFRSLMLGDLLKNELQLKVTTPQEFVEGQRTREVLSFGEVDAQAIF
jgi:hypothetical protein